MNDKTLTVDVRADIRSGREPFSKIMIAAAATQAGERLLVIAPFETVPLYRVLEKQGFVHTGHATSSGDWEILFTRQPGMAGRAIPCPPPHDGTGLISPPLPDGGQGTARPAFPGLTITGALPAPPQIVEVDARGLEPPQPMVKILEALVALPAGAELRARTERRPMHLYPHLEERGFTAATEEQPDGTFLTHIRR
jgi:uncharacterized protein (DUF2249 family)